MFDNRNRKEIRMSTVTIGVAERNLDAVTPEWVEHEVQHQRRHHRAVCVRLSLHHGPVNMRLATPTCASSPGGGRPPNAPEQELFNEWNQRGLGSNDWTVHNLIAFLKHVRHILN
jgi:hypothetical protein